MATRSESFLSRSAGARHRHRGRACDRRRRASSSRCASSTSPRMGAFVGVPGAHIQTNNFSRCFPGMYAIPRIEVDVQCVFTNTVPTGPYRGAGRPEANYALERLVDEAARVTGIDPIRLRRRNLIPRKSDSVQDRGRHDLRLAAISRRSSTRRWRSRTTPNSRSAAANRCKRRKLARHRRLVLPRTCGRHSDRKRGAVVSRAATGWCSASACRTPGRATPRSIRVWWRRSLAFRPRRSRTGTATPIST